jgi:trehalose-phosphatase
MVPAQNTLPVEAMRILNPAVDLHAFFERLGAARDCVLLTDYDGTLAPFHERPECARPWPAAVAAIEALMEQRTTRVVIVSGRELKELVPLLPFRRRPEIWGAHGWQRLLPDGRLLERETAGAARAKLDEAARQARAWERSGARLESKPASVALHWRGLPAAAVEKVRDAALRAWQSHADGASVELLGFDGGLELRALGHNKHDAVKTVLSETPGGSVAAYLGDDATDEDAFAAVKPRGLAVLVRGEARPTRADLWVRPPDGLVAFLERWKERRETVAS